ncbi:GNAT family N-acetyltransferase [Aestuariicella hydrocarbonica]|uniref:GNAT family N-acetyltransferase n=1 Tax=Pseudomaricurvus hydrocarbonicus TaxID=1470433 RepID=A0A9E5K0F9_9GAMM|nr:GNAT family N-acetyltransferase [Aestuariicella hydrocarbonica]NHO66272.1 GNAT family N-acetyltransferase [Aestuariicella hydrocarbonica]
MIEPVSSENLHEVLPLIRQYQAFYGVTEITDARNAAFFAQFGVSNPAGCQFAYRSSGKVVGFATVYLTFNSTIAAKVAVMNDLFTLADCRGQGVGRQLIERCREYAAECGAARLQWVTAPDNEPAQRLYDALDTNQREWKFYTCPVATQI